MPAIEATSVPRKAAGSRERPAARRALALPPVLVLAVAAWLATEDGGFLPGATALASVVLLGGLLVWIMVAPQPVAGFTRTGLLGIGGFACFAAWTLLSATWSSAPARGLVEFDRALLYLTAFALMAALPGGTLTARRLLRLTALVLGAVAVAGLLSRLYPDFSAEAAASADERLGWPLGYWNSLGLAAALALLALAGLSADLRERAWVRVLAAGAVPAVAVALYLTLSRGAIAAGAAGLAVLLVAGFSRGMPGTLVAVLPFTAWAVSAAYGADALVDAVGGDAASARDGRELAPTVAWACAGAALARLVVAAADVRLRGLALWRPWPLRRRLLAAGLAGIVVVGAALAAGAAGQAERQWERFTTIERVEVEQARDRLSQASANGRLENWQVAWDAWRDAPVAGHGAGTYTHLWAQDRPSILQVQDGHSLYLEVLAELGGVGLALLLVAFAVPVGALLRRRGEDRLLWSTVLALAVCWLLRAGADWDWEMPALTLPVVALLGAACARDRARPPGRYARSRLLRLVAGLAVLLVIVTPARMAVAQHHLERSLASFEAGDCGASIEASLRAIEAVGTLPAPFELLGYCDVRRGRGELGVRMLEAAIRREPRSWELHYGLALVRGATGLDPRPAVRRARELNPREALVLEAAERLDSPRPRAWVRESRRLPLVLPGY